MVSVSERPPSDPGFEPSVFTSTSSLHLREMRMDDLGTRIPSSDFDTILSETTWHAALP